jgi:DNA-binding NarL/FixJ family response regulator
VRPATRRRACALLDVTPDEVRTFYPVASPPRAAVAIAADRQAHGDEWIATDAEAAHLTASDAEVLVVGCAADSPRSDLLGLSPQHVRLPMLAIYERVDLGHVVAACQVGIAGHIGDDDESVLRLALEAVHVGMLTIAPTIWRRFSAQYLAATSDLPPRDRQLLTLMASGASNQRIATALHCTPRAVELRLATLYQRLGVANRAQLAAWWAQTLATLPSEFTAA